MGQTTIKVTCLDQRLIVAVAPQIASGGKNENKIQFDFCPLWDEFVKVASFWRNIEDVYSAVIDGEKTCVIPWEVLADEGEFFFSVFGVKDDTTRTSDIVKYKVVKGAITESTKVSDPTPEMYEQLLAICQQMLDGLDARFDGKANADHKHSAADISGGTIPVGNGGTGATDAAGARRNIGAAEVRDGIVLTDNLGGFGTGTSAGSWWKIWNIGNGAGNYPLAFMPSQDGTQELGNPDHRIKKVYANEYSGGKWHGDAVDVDRGGTGATDAESARNNLGAAAKNHTHSKSQITDFPTSMPASDVHPWAKAETKPSYTAADVGAAPCENGFVMIANLGGFGTSTKIGDNWLVWNLSDGNGNHPLALLPSQDSMQLLGTWDNKIKEVWADCYKSGVWDGQTIAIEKGGTGATTKAAARKNLGLEIQIGTIETSTSGVQLTFPEAFSGIPVVTANSSSQTSVRVTEVTATGCRLTSGESKSTVQWQAIYIND